jgi:hypothetical protein
MNNDIPLNEISFNVSWTVCDGSQGRAFSAPCICCATTTKPSSGKIEPFYKQTLHMIAGQMDLFEQTGSANAPRAGEQGIQHLPGFSEPPDPYHPA